MSDSVVQIQNLRRHFGKKCALNGVDLEIPSGCVFGLVGENGAGKTTMLKHILGLYRPQEGSVDVFGYSPADNPVEVLSEIGYLSEDRSQPAWMTIEQIIGYTSAFYPKWDHAFASELREMFELSPSQKISSLSRGQRARIGLLLALAYRPKLLVLDEPSSGLDAVVRQDILSAIIRTVADDGRTVLFSSHLLDEVQRVSDRFAMIDDGRVILVGEMNDVLGSYTKLVVRFDEPKTSLTEYDAVAVNGGGKEWSVICNGNRDSLTEQLVAAGGEIVEKRGVSLEEVFVAKAKHTGSEAAK